ncbi:MAG: hypothetical protein H6Q33_3725 [Deltaproteobacteria bacterium]|nr:hypothetical protein [Deltaproteobacteria bacterium]
MSAAGTSKLSLHCNHCGRQVGETVHTRSSYAVDYYVLHTGAVEPMTIQRADEPYGRITVLKLIEPRTVVTCADCYRQPTIQEERDLLFRPELSSADEPEAATDAR